jgi:Peptidase propeptide and YPEB domain.
MNKKYIFLSFLSLILYSCTHHSISLNDAKKAAIKDAEINEKLVSFSKAYEEDNVFYLEFNDNKRQYIYTIDEDGVIKSKDYYTMETSQCISKDNAIDIALSVYNLNNEAINDIQVNSNKERYEIQYTINKRHYLVYVDKNNGDIIKKTKK